MNPFLVGNPVPPENFVGRDDLISDIFSKLQTKPVHNIALVGLPRFGKSSLLNYITNENVRRRYLRDRSSRYIFCEVDLHDLPLNCDSDSFWQHVLDRAGHQSPPRLSARRRLEHFLSALLARQERFVLLIDEFDAIFAYPNLITSDFLGSLRTQASKSQVLSVIIALPWGLTECDRRIEQKIRIPTGSPYLNVFLPFWIGPFSSNEVDSLIDKYLGRRRNLFDDNDRAWISEISGCLPVVVQAAASLLYDVRLRAQRFDEEALTFTLLGQVEHHFEKLFRLLPPAARQTFYQVCQKVRMDVSTQPFSQLDLQSLVQHGLIEKTAGRWQVRSRSLMEWINLRPIDAPVQPVLPHPRTSFSTAKIRSIMKELLLTDTDFDRFCLDCESAVFRRFAGSMDRVAKENLFLQAVDHQKIWIHLKKETGFSALEGIITQDQGEETNG